MPGRLPAATPTPDPWSPEKARAGSWQLAQLVPCGSESRASKKMARPSATRGLSVAAEAAVSPGKPALTRRAVAAPATATMAAQAAAPKRAAARVRAARVTDGSRLRSEGDAAEGRVGRGRREQIRRSRERASESGGVDEGVELTAAGRRGASLADRIERHRRAAHAARHPAVRVGGRADGSLGRPAARDELVLGQPAARTAAAIVGDVQRVES